MLECFERYDLHVFERALCMISIAVNEEDDY